jgi:DNA-binding Xre family transcriptional regulator
MEHHVSLRGYDNTAAFLRKQGFSNWISHKLTHNQLSGLRFDELERLCSLFRCTPNDLFRWQPEKNMKDAASHPLNALNEKRADGNLISSLNYEHLKEILKIVGEKK